MGSLSRDPKPKSLEEDFWSEAPVPELWLVFAVEVVVLEELEVFDEVWVMASEASDLRRA